MQRPKSNPLSPSVKNLFYFSWQIGLEGADMGLRELAAGQSWIIVLKPRIRYIYWSLEPYSSLSCACIMQIWQIGKDWRRSWVWNGAESEDEDWSETDCVPPADTLTKQNGNNKGHVERFTDLPAGEGIHLGPWQNYYHRSQLIPKPGYHLCRSDVLMNVIIYFSKMINVSLTFSTIQVKTHQVRTVCKFD